mmetsp:Transcript_24663/g.52326  ORF Transcript_24663/g.52326 Transcript_24663/m.52326 type:complete len:383 (-) Transcript_24663:79-1227(-)
MWAVLRALASSETVTSAIWTGKSNGSEPSCHPQAMRGTCLPVEVRPVTLKTRGSGASVGFSVSPSAEGIKTARRGTELGPFALAAVRISSISMWVRAKMMPEGERPWALNSTSLCSPQGRTVWPSLLTCMELVLCCAAGAGPPATRCCFFLSARGWGLSSPLSLATRENQAPYFLPRARMREICCPGLRLSSPKMLVRESRTSGPELQILVKASVMRSFLSDHGRALSFLSAAGLPMPPWSREHCVMVQTDSGTRATLRTWFLCMRYVKCAGVLVALATRSTRSAMVWLRGTAMQMVRPTRGLTITWKDSGMEVRACCMPHCLAEARNSPRGEGGTTGQLSSSMCFMKGRPKSCASMCAASTLVKRGRNPPTERRAPKRLYS